MKNALSWPRIITFVPCGKCMMYYRRKVLLALIETFGGRMCPISLQKALFLFTREQDTDNRVYSFVPYKYGCFSFNANHDIAVLQKYGFLSFIDKEIAISAPGNYVSDLNLFDSSLLIKIYDQFKGFTDDDYIDYTYKLYPYYAINSEIAYKHLSEDQLEEVRKKDHRKTYSNHTLFTIGYEGKSLEEYLNKLLIHGVRTLCDVRKNAYSQKYGFSKAQLQPACEGVGIKYIHIPELGIDSDQRRSLFSQADYDILFEQYRKTVLAKNDRQLERIVDLIDKDERVALTCFEKNVNQCHRTQIARKLMSLPDIKFDFKEI